MRVTLLLQGVRLGIGRAVDLDLLSLHLDTLTGTERSDQTTIHAQAGTRRDGLEALLRNLLQIDHNLDIAHARTVVQRNEGYVFVTALGAHPTLDYHVGIDGARVENLYNALRFHIVDFSYLS